MNRAACAALLLAGCSSPASIAPYNAGAGASDAADGASDAAALAADVFEPVEASPLFAPCEPCASDAGACPSSCADGLDCFGAHTSSAWYDADVFGHCVILGCQAGEWDECAALHGTCACPTFADGSEPHCDNTDGGTVDVTAMVCVPIPVRK